MGPRAPGDAAPAVQARHGDQGRARVRALASEGAGARGPRKRTRNPLTGEERRRSGAGRSRAVWRDGQPAEAQVHRWGGQGHAPVARATLAAKQGSHCGRGRGQSQSPAAYCSSNFSSGAQQAVRGCHPSMHTRRAFPGPVLLHSCAKFTASCSPTASHLSPAIYQPRDPRCRSTSRPSCTPSSILRHHEPRMSLLNLHRKRSPSRNPPPRPPRPPPRPPSPSRTRTSSPPAAASGSSR